MVLVDHNISPLFAKPEIFLFKIWICQNISKKVFLKGPQFQAKMPSGSRVFIQREEHKYTLPLRTKETGHKMCIVLVILVSYSVHYDSSLQNATDIISKCDSYFIIKRDKFITRCIRTMSYKIVFQLSK